MPILRLLAVQSDRRKLGRLGHFGKAVNESIRLVGHVARARSRFQGKIGKSKVPDPTHCRPAIHLLTAAHLPLLGIPHPCLQVLEWANQVGGRMDFHTFRPYGRPQKTPGILLRISENPITA